MANGSFATVINCMDGRVQVNANKYISEKYGVDYVDTITLAGPCKVIADQDHKGMIDNIKFRMDISVNRHFSKVACIVGHVDCAAVEVSDKKQKELVLEAVEVVKKWNLVDFAEDNMI